MCLQNLSLTHTIFEKDCTILAPALLIPLKLSYSFRDFQPNLTHHLSSFYNESSYKVLCEIAQRFLVLFASRFKSSSNQDQIILSVNCFTTTENLTNTSEKLNMKFLLQKERSIRSLNKIPHQGDNQNITIYLYFFKFSSNFKSKPAVSSLLNYSY